MSDLDDALALALELADAAAPIARRAWLGAVDVSYKADGSSLTEADLAIERLWRERIRARFPAHGVLGEEFGEDRGASAFTWVLDPIDGTRPFGAGLPSFASLLSLCRDGAPVLGIIDPPVPGARSIGVEGRGSTFGGRTVRTSGRATLHDAVVAIANPDSFSAETAAGVRRLRETGATRVYDGGSPAYGALARGRIDVCVNGDDLEPFDICALCPVVWEAGGALTDWAGRAPTIATRGAIVASASDALHDRARAALCG